RAVQPLVGRPRPLVGRTQRRTPALWRAEADLRASCRLGLISCPFGRADTSAGWLLLALCDEPPLWPCQAIPRLRDATRCDPRRRGSCSVDRSTRADARPAERAARRAARRAPSSSLETLPDRPGALRPGSRPPGPCSR